MCYNKFHEKFIVNSVPNVLKMITSTYRIRFKFPSLSRAKENVDVLEIGISTGIPGLRIRCPPWNGNRVAFEANILSSVRLLALSSLDKASG